ncbi:MAG: DUF2155 domain-containing protein [Pseudomonadota bacterium]
MPRLRHPLLCAAIVAVAGTAGAPVAQEVLPQVDETRVIIPRAKIVRIDETPAEQVETETEADDTGETQVPVIGSTFETSPLAPIGEEEPENPLDDLTAGAVGTGAIFSVPEDQLALQTDPTLGETGLSPEDEEEPTRVRVISPGRTDRDYRDGTGILTPEEQESDEGTEEQDGRPQWLRQRTRRFKVAPKGDETLDTDRSFAIPIASIDTEIKTGARLRQLDKMTGQTVTFELLAGETRQVDRLVVRLDACRSPETNASHGVMAFLSVRDTRNTEGEPDFTGWMFAESPALSALDHPRYDLWVISCTTSAGDVSAVSE